MESDNTKLLARYKRLIETSKDLASTLDLDSLLNRIIVEARDITEAQAASILLYDSTARQFYFHVATNMDPLMQEIVVPIDSIAGWIISNRQAVRITDATKDERHFAEVAKKLNLDTHSLLGVPLIAKDKAIGVLEVINRQGGAFSPDDEEMLTAIASQAAIAIENTRLFQQSDQITEFVHELRTPLASISTAAYLLTRPDISPGQSQQITANIYSETLRLSAMATSFLDLARLESGRVQFQKKEFPLGPLLEECVVTLRMEAAENEVEITLVAPAEMPAVLGDREKIKQVCLNLISNAVKYNRPGGNVTLSAGLDENTWWVKVQDSGNGIPAQELPNLFQKFYRAGGQETRVKGTGLGLSICKAIVEGHRGKIGIESQVGLGTTFTVIIPRK